MRFATNFRALVWMEHILAQILVGVASNHVRFLTTEVGKVSMGTAIEHGLAGPKISGRPAHALRAA